MDTTSQATQTGEFSPGISFDVAGDLGSPAAIFRLENDKGRRLIDLSLGVAHSNDHHARHGRVLEEDCFDLGGRHVRSVALTHFQEFLDAVHDVHIAVLV